VVGRGDGQVNSFGYRQGRTPGRTSRTCTLAKSEAEFLVSKAEVLIGKPRSHMELPQARHAAHAGAASALAAYVSTCLTLHRHAPRTSRLANTTRASTTRRTLTP
jgi:hypothetical protein